MDPLPRAGWEAPACSAWPAARPRRVQNENERAQKPVPRMSHVPPHTRGTGCHRSLCSRRGLRGSKGPRDSRRRQEQHPRGERRPRGGPWGAGCLGLPLAPLSLEPRSRSLGPCPLGSHHQWPVCCFLSPPNIFSNTVISPTQSVFNWSVS